MPLASVESVTATAASAGCADYGFPAAQTLLAAPAQGRNGLSASHCEPLEDVLMSLFAGESGALEEGCFDSGVQSSPAPGDRKEDEVPPSGDAAGIPASIWTAAQLLCPPAAPPVAAIQPEINVGGSAEAVTEREAESSHGSSLARAVQSERMNPAPLANGLEWTHSDLRHSDSGDDGLSSAAPPWAGETRPPVSGAAKADSGGENLEPPEAAPREAPRPLTVITAGWPVRGRSAMPRPSQGPGSGPAPAGTGQSSAPLLETGPESSAAVAEAVAGGKSPDVPSLTDPGSLQQPRTELEQRVARTENSAKGSDRGREAPVHAGNAASTDRSGRSITVQHAEQPQPGGGGTLETKPGGQREAAAANGGEAVRQAAEGPTAWAAGGPMPSRESAPEGRGETRQAAPVRELADSTPEPAPRRLMLRVEGNEGQRVDIRLFQSPGSLRVQLSSTQSGLAEGLRAQVHELQRSLETAGWRAQVGVAAEPGAAASAGLESSTAESLARDSRAGQDARASLGSPFASGGNHQGASQKGAELEEEFLDLSAIRRLQKGARQKP